LTAAIDRQRAGEPHQQAYLVIDEFQRLAGDNFRIILEQARSFGVAAILANQTQADLQTPDGDLRPTVRTNTRLKLYFSVSDPAEVRQLMESSGEELALMRSWSGSVTPIGPPAGVVLQGWNEIVKPRLTRNDIISASDHPLHAIAHISRGSGYTQYGGLPLPVRSTWPIDVATYKRRSAAPWPEAEPGMVTSPAAIATIEHERDEEAAAALVAEKAKLKALLATKADQG
jgi:hypothetical protein